MQYAVRQQNMRKDKNTILNYFIELRYHRRIVLSNVTVLGSVIYDIGMINEIIIESEKYHIISSN